MDSPESEWEIQESPGENSSKNGKLSWMLRLGKKILVSGIVISSAPIVLPPLVVISAVGLACSVPYGVFLVSYACTQTVMNRLLPMPLPASPLLLEYRKELDGEEEETDWDEKSGGETEVIKGGIDMEREEEELKEDTLQEVEVRLELVDKEEDELHKENDLQGKAGAENGEKKSIEVVGIADEKGYEEEEIIELKAEQPIIEESSTEQPATEGHSFEAVNGEDKKDNSSIKREMPPEAENVEEDVEVVRERRGLLGKNQDENYSHFVRDHKQSVENLDAQSKPTMKNEGITKGKGEQSIAESMNERPGDDIHDSVTKESVNVNKERSSELKNMPAQTVQATDIGKAEPVRESKGSSRRNRKKGRNQKVAEENSGVRREIASTEGKLPKVNEGTSKRKQEQELPLSRDNEKNDNNREEMQLEETNLPAHSVYAIDVEENERLMTEAGGTSERVRDESDTEIVNIGGEGNQSRDIEMKIDGKIEVKVEKCIQEETMSKQPIEEVSNVVVEFEEGEKNGSKNEMEIPFHMKAATVQLSQSTDIEEDKELVRGTRGLLEKIRDEGKADYAVDSKLSTEKEPVGAEKDNKKIGGDVKKPKRRGARAHDRGGKPTKKLEPKGEEVKADEKVQMKGCGENVDVVPEEMKMVEGLSENTDEAESAIIREGGQAENHYHNVEQNFSNEGEREMINDEKLDLLEDLSTISQQGSPSGVNTFEESQPSSSYSVHQDSSDSSDLPVSTKAEESDDIPISAGNAIDTASNEPSLYSEGKIWEQIEALRTIVGYKAARQETSIQELKALYLFTGIEPPASFKDTSDIAEVNAKLRFLMSVVGVK